jgi:hypothetical protein
MGGFACAALVRPYAAFRFERTKLISAFGRAGVFRASIRAWRLVPIIQALLERHWTAGGFIPEPEMRTVSLLFVEDIAEIQSRRFSSQVGVPLSGRTRTAVPFSILAPRFLD